MREGLSDLEPQILRCGAGNTKWREGLVGPWTRPGSPKAHCSCNNADGIYARGRSAVQQGAHLLLWLMKFIG